MSPLGYATMRVFISWSGDISHGVGIALRDWLPSVVQAVVPYVSSEDIEKGSRWSTELSRELETSSFGIICVTPENLNAPWLHFEAGALSRLFDVARVSPFLFGVRRSDITGPFVQFQSTLFEKAEVEKLIRAINAACDDRALDEVRMGQVFEVWWPRLEEPLSRLMKSLLEMRDSGGAGSPRPPAALLEEILDLVRGQERRLSSPDQLLPPEYMRRITKGSALGPRAHGDAQELYINWRSLRRYVAKLDAPEGSSLATLVAMILDLGTLLEGLLRSVGIRVGAWARPIPARSEDEIDEEDISLEAIINELKRREGRA